MDSYRLPRVTPRKRRHGFEPAYLVAIAVFLVMAVAVVIAVVNNNTVSTQTCTVSGKFVTTSADKNHTRIYQVETEQCGVLRVEDNMFQGIWNSADLFAAVHEGKTYEIEAYGWRLPWAGQFPHIKKVSAK